MKFLITSLSSPNKSETLRAFVECNSTSGKKFFSRVLVVDDEWTNLRGVMHNLIFSCFSTNCRIYSARTGNTHASIHDLKEKRCFACIQRQIEVMPSSRRPFVVKLSSRRNRAPCIY